MKGVSECLTIIDAPPGILRGSQGNRIPIESQIPRKHSGSRKSLKLCRNPPPGETSSERFSNLLKATEPLSGRARTTHCALR